MQNPTWIVERRLISDGLEPHSWLAIALTDSLEAAEAQYHLRLLHLTGHEMRLLDPAGNVLRACRDPAAPLRACCLQGAPRQAPHRAAA